MSRPIPPAAVDIIQKWEGYRASPYLCSAGVWTIGYGHVIRHADGSQMTAAEPCPPHPQWDIEAAADALRKDLPGYFAAVIRLCGRNLNDNQLAALTSFTYNLGAGSLRISTLRQEVLRGRHAAAALQFSRWVYAGGIVSRGLQRRRAAEQNLYRTQCAAAPVSIRRAA